MRGRARDQRSRMGRKDAWVEGRRYPSAGQALPEINESPVESAPLLRS